MLAATCGDIETVALLVGNGADWGASRDDGWTVLSLAIAAGNGHVVDFLTQVSPHNGCVRSHTPVLMRA